MGVRHKIAKTGKAYCGRTITTNGDGRDCMSCARTRWVATGETYADVRAKREHRESVLSAERVTDDAGRVGKVTGVYGDTYHATMVKVAWGTEADVTPHYADATDHLISELSPVTVTAGTPARLVTVAPVGTPCGWTAYGETGTRLTCKGGRNAVHILTATLPVAAKGTALCGFHSPYDVTKAEREAVGQPFQAMGEAGAEILAKRAARGQSGMDVLTDLLSLDGGKTPAKVIKVESGCRSLNHVYCVGPCPIRTRNEANASAARTHVETEEECLARIKREDFRVGDAYTFRSLVGYRPYQDRPFACRGLRCQCGNACHGTTVESVEILTDVAHYVSGGLEIRGDKGSRAVIRVDRLD